MRSITLHPDQEAILERVRAKFTNGRKRVMMQAPTAFGKTVCFSELTARVRAKNKRILILAHREELIDQISSTLTRFNIEHGTAVRGNRRMLRSPVLVASIQTVMNHLHHLPDPDLIIFDEAHRCGAKSYQKIAFNYPNSLILGTSATPERLDGKPLSDMFEDIVIGPPIRELIEMGRLSDYEYYYPGISPDLTGVKIVRGDYDQVQLDEIMRKPKLIGNAVNHYKKTAHNKRALVFCASIAHSIEVAKMFCAQGYKFIHVDGNTDKTVRKQAIKDLCSGAIHGITNCNLFVEGVDVPMLDCVILMRPTQSLMIYMQAIGRGLRKYDGKEKVIILDHAGCIYRHGLPDWGRQWTLEGRKKSEKNILKEISVKIKHCEKCLSIYESHKVSCPRCGHVPEKKGREIEEKEGELIKIEASVIESLREQMKKEQSGAKTLEDLIGIAQKRGYKTGWAHHVHRTRQNRRER